jgi:two-component system, OmpR family, KDP operon response regulator KdpE
MSQSALRGGPWARSVVPDYRRIEAVTDSMHLALIVEDDLALQSVLTMLFEANGFRVVIAGTAAGGMQAARQHKPDILLVDLGLPDRDGLEVITHVRTWSGVPVLVLTARDEEAQRLAAFDKGADDYVIKPFSAPELLARVRAMLRRHVRAGQPMAILKIGHVEVDMGYRVARDRTGRAVHLTPIEHRILEVLVRHGERIVTLAVLLREVWGPQRDDARGLRVYIGSLRKKLEPEPDKPQHILTELGIGYRLVLDPRRTS